MNSLGTKEERSAEKTKVGERKEGTRRVGREADRAKAARDAPGFELQPGPGPEGGCTDLPSGSLAANAASAPWLRKNCRAVSPAPAAPTTAPATKPLRNRREPLSLEAKLFAAISTAVQTFLPPRMCTVGPEPDDQS